MTAIGDGLCRGEVTTCVRILSKRALHRVDAF